VSPFAAAELNAEDGIGDASPSRAEKKPSSSVMDWVSLQAAVPPVGIVYKLKTKCIGPETGRSEASNNRPCSVRDGGTPGTAPAAECMGTTAIIAPTSTTFASLARIAPSPQPRRHETLVDRHLRCNHGRHILGLMPTLLQNRGRLLVLAVTLAAVGVAAARMLVARPPERPATSNDAREAFVTALNAQKDGRYHDAREGYLRALSLDPKMADARYQLAVITQAAGAYGEAEHNIEQLEAISPNDPRVAELRARLGHASEGGAP
jgi:hypothetical protein